MAGEPDSLTPVTTGTTWLLTHWIARMTRLPDVKGTSKNGWERTCC